MSGISEKRGIPYVWNVPCVRDTEYKFLFGQLVGITEWLCPHCLQHLHFENEEMFCAKGCHLLKNANRKSAFSNIYKKGSHEKAMKTLVNDNKLMKKKLTSELAVTC